ncbi:MAG: cytochrome c [Myxococcota bacterium]
MVSLVKGIEEIDRGLLLNDYRLVGVRAREVQDAARIMQMDQVIDFSFQLKPSARASFKKYARKLDKRAREIEKAAEEGDPATILTGVQGMFQEGCIPCHKAYR